LLYLKNEEIKLDEIKDNNQ